MANDKKSPIIYGIRKGEKLIYIGKSDSDKIQKKSKLGIIYSNSKLKKETLGFDIELEKITDSDLISWYKDRNNEAHGAYVGGEEHLINDQFILDGKNGYWEGKKRDANTLKNLSESKHKKVVQYDKDGNLLKIWDSIKEAAIKIFKDYVVVNGGSHSELYYVLKNKMVKNKYRKNSYWFTEEDILKEFIKIPQKININVILEKSKITRKHTKPKYKSVYSVKQLDRNNKTKYTYVSAKHAARRLNTDANNIQKACRLGRLYAGHYWEYGDKIKRKCDNDGNIIIDKPFLRKY